MGTKYMIFKLIAKGCELFRNKITSVRDVQASEQISMYINSVLRWDELPSKALLCHLIWKGALSMQIIGKDIFHHSHENSI